MRRAFTLIELMVVIAIITIIAAIAIPSLIEGPVKSHRPRYVIGTQANTYRVDAITRLPDGGVQFVWNGRLVEVHGNYILEDRGQ